MIHFNFIVTDEEAEIIFDIIQTEIARCHHRKLSSTKQEFEWFDKHIEYLTSLKVKMKNTRVE